MGPVFVSSYPRLRMAKGWDAFILGCHYYQHIFVPCIFNIFETKQKTGNPTLTWITFLKTTHKPPESSTNETWLHGSPCFIFTRCKTHGTNLCHCNLPGSLCLNHEGLQLHVLGCRLQSCSPELWRNKLTRRIVSQPDVMGSPRRTN